MSDFRALMATKRKREGTLRPCKRLDQVLYIRFEAQQTRSVKAVGQGPWSSGPVAYTPFVHRWTVLYKPRGSRFSPRSLRSGPLRSRGDIYDLSYSIEGAQSAP
jgi:hypothetical protein